MKFISLLKSIAIYIGLIIGFVILHELAHGLTAIAFGGELKGIWITSYFGWGEKADNIDDFQIYSYTSYNDSIFAYRAVKVAGSLVSVICASLVNYLSQKKENLPAFVATWAVMVYETLYWAISPLIKFGDAYQLLQSIEGINLSFIFFFSLTFFILLICICIILFKKLINMLENIYIVNLSKDEKENDNDLVEDLENVLINVVIEK
ncbi:MAG: hypothetical protein ACFFAN_15575 [Promethearchaeota archaeon]